MSIYQCGQLYSNQFIMSCCVTILLCILLEEVQIRSWGAFLDGAFSDLCSASVYFRTRGKCCSVYLDRPSWPFVIFPYFMFLLFWPELNVLCSHGLLCRHVTCQNLHVINILHSFKMWIGQILKVIFSQHPFLEDEFNWFFKNPFEQDSSC